MDSKPAASTSTPTPTPADPALYPDLAEAGSLADALDRAATAEAVDIGGARKSEGDPLRCAFVTSLVSERGGLNVYLGSVERVFIITAWSQGIQSLSGSTADLREVARVAAAWRCGQPLHEMQSDAAFPQVGNLALAQESGGPGAVVALKWLRLREETAKRPSFEHVSHLVEATCSRCGRRAAVRAGTREEPVCGRCALPDSEIWKTCPGCGEEDRLIQGECGRCNLQQRLNSLLRGSTGEIRCELRALNEHLAALERPETVQNWLRNPIVATALASLAADTREPTHAALDELPPSKPLQHLRSVLVATGALPERDEHFARLERWITQAINERRDLRDRELLRRYAVWHLLRRLRQRNRDSTITYGQLDTVRQRVSAALALLAWLRERELTLATCHQADLDAWRNSTETGHRDRAGHFVRWAITRGINRDLCFPATRWSGAARPLDHEQRWQQARKLMHDNALAVEDRVTGLLLLLYAQRPSTISRLALDDFEVRPGSVALRLGTVPVTLPEPLAALTRELIAIRRGHAVLGQPARSSWLFPGGQPGRHVSADRLGQRLRQLGLQPAETWSTALFQLATELPAAILARTLGIHIKVAVSWQHLAAGDWTTYAAELSQRPRKAATQP